MAMPGGLVLDRGVDLADVAVVQVLGVFAAAGDLGALGGVVEVGQAGVVELQVGAAQGAEPGDLVGVGGGQVGPELLDVGVDRRVQHGRAAAVVDHVRRRDRLLGHGGGHLGLQEREVIAEDRLGQMDLAADVQRGRGPLDVSRRVGELDLDVTRGLGDAAEGVDEVHVPGGPAEFPVGGGLQADLLLHAHRLADLLILDRAQLGGRDLACGEVVAGLEQPRRAQQAADVVGAERGAGPTGHGKPFSISRGDERARASGAGLVPGQQPAARRARWRPGRRGASG